MSINHYIYKIRQNCFIESDKQCRQYTFELAWKTLKDYLTLEGFEVRSPRETIRQGFQSGYIMNGEDWLQALADRNLTTHIYDDEIIIRVLNDIFERILQLLWHEINV